MSQTVTSSFAAQGLASAKGLDYAFVIAGWPTVYTVAKSSYALAGDFAQFVSLQPWADVPTAVGASVKGRPEDGGLTLGQMKVTILDRVSSGIRSLSELLSREAALRAPQTLASLTADLSNSNTEVAASTLGYPQSGGVFYVGLECIRYTATTSTAFTGCTRGYRLTSATPHPLGARVYSFMPSLYRRKAFLYKGYQNLGMEHWARGFGGNIVGAAKEGPAVTFSVLSTTSEMDNNGRRVAFCSRVKGANIPIFGSMVLQADVLAGNFSSIQVNVPFATTNLANGHYLVNIGGQWNAITGVS